MSMRYSFSGMVLLLLLSWVGPLCQLNQQMLPRKWINPSCDKTALPFFWAELSPDLHSYRSSTTHFPDSWHIPLYKDHVSILIQHKPDPANPDPACTRPIHYYSHTTQELSLPALVIVPYSGRHNISRYWCIRFLHSLQKVRNPAWI